MEMKKEQDWREFEIAVANWLRKLDPNAVIQHNFFEPDKHIGTRRQRDIWVVGEIAGIEINILVSCKKYKRRVNHQDIDAFYGELASSKASLGIIYSYSSFSNNAILKASALGIQCMTFFNNEFPRISEAIIFPEIYYWRMHKLGIDAYLGDNSPTPTTQYWIELFENGVNSNTGNNILCDIICVLQDLPSRNTCRQEGVIHDCLSFECSYEMIPILVQIKIHWRIFHALNKGFKLFGAFCFNKNRFQGEQTTPSFPLDSWDFSDDWEELQSFPTQEKQGISIYQMNSNYDETFKELGAKKIKWLTFNWK